MRYVIKFSYDGTLFSGYQLQPNKRTVQGCLEEALQKINNGKYSSVVATGRTDKGVHALEQYAHLDVDVNITPYKLKRAFNSHLPDDIHVIETYEVDNDFCVRYQVISKKYEYHLNMGEYNPMRRNYCYQHNYALDIDKMKEAISYFVGVHDFRAFVTENVLKENCVREIFEASIEHDSFYPEEIIFTFVGNGFMRYQVRNMVGILMKVGTGKIAPSVVKEILDSKIRGKHGSRAPAEGLYLKEVHLKNNKMVNIN